VLWQRCLWPCRRGPFSPSGRRLAAAVLRLISGASTRFEDAPVRRRRRRRRLQPSPPLHQPLSRLASDRPANHTPPAGSVSSRLPLPSSIWPRKAAHGAPPAGAVVGARPAGAHARPDAARLLARRTVSRCSRDLQTGKRSPLTLTYTSARAPRYIFTGGADTLVRVFQTAKGAEAEPSVLQEHSEEITFLDCSVRRQPPETGTRKLS
jgi:hypothetical protein